MMEGKEKTSTPLTTEEEEFINMLPRQMIRKSTKAIIQFVEKNPLFFGGLVIVVIMTFLVFGIIIGMYTYHLHVLTDNGAFDFYASNTHAARLIDMDEKLDVVLCLLLRLQEPDQMIYPANINVSHKYANKKEESGGTDIPNT